MAKQANRSIQPLAAFFHAPMSGYYKNTSTTIACQADQRFSYCTYLPKSWTPETASEYQLLVVIHGSDRVHQETRNHFIELAEQRNLIILSPLFPVGIIDPQDTDGYKYIEYQGIRFDLLLLEMIKEIETRYSAHFDTFSLFGFSGGAHFSHRFFYIHPEKVFALSIASPGSVTLINDNADWWVGTKNFHHVFGKTLNIAAMQKTNVQFLVGAHDTENNLIIHTEDSPHWCEGANGAGNNRVERIRSLHANWVEHKIQSHLFILPNIGHSLEPLAQNSSKFFNETLS